MTALGASDMIKSVSGLGAGLRLLKAPALVKNK
jgi:hypothetical protein